MRTNLDREKTTAILFETRSKNETARQLATSRYTLEQHLKVWGVHVDFKRGDRVERNADVFQKGDLVTWRPIKTRPGYFGLPAGKEPWACVVQAGPDSRGYYVLKYDGPDNRKREQNKIHSVVGSRLFKRESTND